MEALAELVEASHIELTKEEIDSIKYGGPHLYFGSRADLTLTCSAPYVPRPVS